MASTGAGLEGVGIDGAPVGDDRSGEDAWRRRRAARRRGTRLPRPPRRPRRPPARPDAVAVAGLARRRRDGRAAHRAAADAAAPPRRGHRDRARPAARGRDVLARPGRAWSTRCCTPTSAPEPSVTFSEPGRSGWDAADLVLRALLPTVGEVGEVRRAWRARPDGRRRCAWSSSARPATCPRSPVRSSGRCARTAAPPRRRGDRRGHRHHRLPPRGARRVRRPLARRSPGLGVRLRPPSRVPGLPGPRTGAVPSPPELVRHG